jgi:hypothetical protein
MRKALVGAFLLGALIGVCQTGHPWRGKSILVNAGLVSGWGIGVAVLMAIIWTLTFVRQWAAALIRRKGA